MPTDFSPKVDGFTSFPKTVFDVHLQSKSILSLKQMQTSAACAGNNFNGKVIGECAEACKSDSQCNAFTATITKDQQKHICGDDVTPEFNTIHCDLYKSDVKPVRNVDESIQTSYTMNIPKPCDDVDDEHIIVENLSPDCNGNYTRMAGFYNGDFAYHSTNRYLFKNDANLGGFIISQNKPGFAPNGRLGICNCPKGDVMLCDKHWYTVKSDQPNTKAEIYFNGCPPPPQTPPPQTPSTTTNTNYWD